MACVQRREGKHRSRYIFRPSVGSLTFGPLLRFHVEHNRGRINDPPEKYTTIKVSSARLSPFLTIQYSKIKRIEWDGTKLLKIDRNRSFYSVDCISIPARYLDDTVSIRSRPLL